MIDKEALKQVVGLTLHHMDQGSACCVDFLGGQTETSLIGFFEYLSNGMTDDVPSVQIFSSFAMLGFVTALHTLCESMLSEEPK